MVRHGQSTWNASGRWQGHADAPLTELGRTQAARAVASLPSVEVIWASDLERARATATVIGDALGLEVQVDARLRERNAGEWTGLTRAEIERGWPRLPTSSPTAFASTAAFPHATTRCSTARSRS